MAFSMKSISTEKIIKIAGTGNLMKKSFCIIIFFLFFINTNLFSDETIEKKEALKLGTGFYYSLYKTRLIERDSFLEKKINSIVLADGIVKKSLNEKRYKNEFCIVVREPDSEKYRVKIDYYVFFKSLEDVKNFVSGMGFSFRGQMAGFTPVNSSRTHFIIDIIYESGTVTID